MVTYETLCEDGFLEALQNAYPQVDWKKIAGGDVEGWAMVSNKGRYRGILQETLGHDSEDVKKVAIELVNYLGAMGYQEFGELLK